MSGRERLVAWAKSEETGQTFKDAVLKAEKISCDNIDGDDDHILFVRTLIEELELKRVNNRPMKKIASGPIAIALAVKSGVMTKHQIARKLAGIYGVSPNTMRNRMSCVGDKMEYARTMFAFENLRYYE